MKHKFTYCLFNVLRKRFVNIRLALNSIKALNENFMILRADLHLLYEYSFEYAYQTNILNSNDKIFTCLILKI